jgi:hypothetical protein
VSVAPVIIGRRKVFRTCRSVAGRNPAIVRQRSYVKPKWGWPEVTWMSREAGLKETRMSSGPVSVIRGEEGPRGRACGQRTNKD